MKEFDKAVDRSKVNSVKWNKDAIKNIAINTEALPFWVADMDFYPEEHIKEKGKEIAELGIYGYPTFPNLLDSFIFWVKKRHDWDTAKENVTFTMGLLHGIALALDIFTSEHDKILVPTPTYRPFREICSRSNRELVEYPLGYKDYNFFLDRNSFIEKAKDCKVILFCSPHNPSGLVFSHSDLDFILNFSKENDILVISDEIHADLVHPSSTHFPMGKVNEKIGAKVITYMAPSKTFNVAGEHSGFAHFSSLEMLQKFNQKRDALFLSNPGYLIGELTEAAYYNGYDYNKALCSYLEENSNFIRKYLEENIPGVKLTNGNASYVTFLDLSLYFDKIKAKVLSDPERYKGGEEGGILSYFLGVEGNVAFNDGTWFGPDYYSFVRFNYGTSREMVKKGLDGIKKALDSL